MVTGFEHKVSCGRASRPKRAVVRFVVKGNIYIIILIITIEIIIVLIDVISLRIAVTEVVDVLIVCPSPCVELRLMS